MLTENDLNSLKKYGQLAIDMADYLGLTGETLDDFLALIGSERFLRTGDYYDVDEATEYMFEPSAKQGNIFHPVKASFMKQKLKDLMNNYEDNLVNKAKKTKEEAHKIAAAKFDNEKSIVPIRFFTYPFEYNRRGQKIEKVCRNSSNVLEINTFKKTDIMEKAMAARASGIRHKTLEFLKKYPHIEFVLRSICVEDERIEYFLNWLSYIFATLQKTHTAIVFKGTPGAGKNFFFEHIISYYLDLKFCPTLPNEQVENRFTPPALKNALFVCFDEVKADFRDGNKIYDKLKLWITSDDLVVELKRDNSYIQENFFNCIFFSNYDIPLQTAESDRRYTIFTTRSKDLADAVLETLGIDMDEFIEKFKKERDDFLIDLVCYAYNSSQVRRPLPTEEKEALQKASDTKQNQFSQSMQKLDQKFFIRLAASMAESISDLGLSRLYWQESFKENDMDISDPEQSQDDIQNLLLLFFRRFIHTIKSNGGFTLSKEVNFIANMHFFDDEMAREGKAPLSSQKISNLLGLNFYKPEKRRIKRFNFDLSVDEKNDCKLEASRGCREWKFLAEEKNKNKNIKNKEIQDEKTTEQN